MYVRKCFLDTLTQAKKNLACSWSIGLMQDHITCSKFSTKPHLATFFQTFVAYVLFSCGYSFHFCCFGNKYLAKFKICILKLTVGGDFNFSDVIVQKSYSTRV